MPNKQPKPPLIDKPEILQLKRGRPNFNFRDLNDEDFNEDDYIIQPDNNDIQIQTEEKPRTPKKARNNWMEPIIEEMMVVGNTSLKIHKMFVIRQKTLNCIKTFN